MAFVQRLVILDLKRKVFHSDSSPLHTLLTALSPQEQKFAAHAIVNQFIKNSCRKWKHNVEKSIDGKSVQATLIDKLKQMLSNIVIIDVNSMKNSCNVALCRLDNDLLTHILGFLSMSEGHSRYSMLCHRIFQLVQTKKQNKTIKIEQKDLENILHKRSSINYYIDCNPSTVEFNQLFVANKYDHIMQQIITSTIGPSGSTKIDN